MKAVDSTGGVGDIFLHAGINPSRSVSGDGLYALALFLSQLLKEFGEGFDTVSFMTTYDLTRIVIYYHGDIFVSLAVAGFIDTYMLQTAIPSPGIRPDEGSGSAYATTDRFPVTS